MGHDLQLCFVVSVIVAFSVAKLTWFDMVFLSASICSISPRRDQLPAPLSTSETPSALAKELREPLLGTAGAAEPVPEMTQNMSRGFATLIHPAERLELGSGLHPTGPQALEGRTECASLPAAPPTFNSPT